MDNASWNGTHPSLLSNESSHWNYNGMIALAVISSYILTSLFFIKFPLLYRKKRQSFRCTHISHRGGAGENLENTMTAFRHAASSAGTQMLEIDCHLSKDGEVVVAHDGLLLAKCGQPLRIAETNYRDLPLMRPKLELDFKKRFFSEARNNDRKIPLLRQVFEEFPDLVVNIDIKEHNDELIKKVSDLIKEFRREHLTVWGNFRDVICQKCYRENPDVPLLFSIRRVLVTVILFYTGLLPFLPIKEQFFEICMPSIFLTQDTNMQVAKRRQWWTVWFVDKILMRKFLFEHLQKRGVQAPVHKAERLRHRHKTSLIYGLSAKTPYGYNGKPFKFFPDSCNKIYIWVLNNEEEFSRAFSLGCDGVMTDFPTRLRAFLDANPQYLPARS